MRRYATLDATEDVPLEQLGNVPPGGVTEITDLPTAETDTAKRLAPDGAGGVAWGTGGSGAPTDADYLVGTANGSLSAEIVVGATPGGELGGTWASPTVDATHAGSAHHDPVTVGTGLDLTGQLVELSLDEVAAGGELAGFMDAPTVDATHSGSTHAATQAAAEATAAGALAAHTGDTGDAHDASAISIADAGGDFTATDVEGALDELQADNEAHAAAADPHAGYVLESLLDAKGDLIAASADNTPAKVTVGADDTILMADAAAGAGLKWVAAGTPSTQAFGDSAVVGTADTFTRGDHKHAMPADPVTAHAADNSTHDVVFVDTPNDVAINNTNDVTINTVDIGSVAAGDQLIVDAWMTILNNSTATRNITLTLDFDAAFDIELTLPALATSATLLQPVHLYGILDVRSTSLAYAMVFCDMQLAAGIASGTDTSAAATHLQAKGWGTSGGDLTGTVTVALFARSANATATQTLRLHSHTIRKVTPT